MLVDSDRAEAGLRAQYCIIFKVSRMLMRIIGSRAFCFPNHLTIIIILDIHSVTDKKLCT